MEMRDTETWKNLNRAFEAEARTAMLYALYAERARAAGDFAAGRLFEKTAENERAHAKVWFRQLYGDVPGTEADLSAAARGERGEWEKMYADFAAQARTDGFAPLAEAFDRVAGIERSHEARYLDLLAAQRDGTVTSRPAPVRWQCEVCGYAVEGEEPPLSCPVCGHARQHFAEQSADPSRP